MGRHPGSMAVSILFDCWTSLSHSGREQGEVLPAETHPAAQQVLMYPFIFFPAPVAAHQLDPSRKGQARVSLWGSLCCGLP